MTLEKTTSETFNSCNVCGECSDSIGWHYGAVTCQACKKFFWRSRGDESTKYLCKMHKNCSITIATRAQCQYCRYEKCLKLGMNEKSENFE